MKLVKRTRIAIVAALLAPAASGLAISESAYAAGCTGAPGASAIQQYCEAVPNADGSRRNAGSGKSKPNVSTSTAKSLAADGADGAAVAALTADGSKNTAAKKTATKSKSKKKKSSSTAAAGATGGSGGTGGGQGAVKALKVDGPKDPSASPLKAATHAVGSGPTVGTGLIWGVVGMSAIGALGAVFLRRRGLNNGFDPPSDES